MVPLNLDKGQETLFKNVETFLKSNSSLDVKLKNKQEESNLALWLSNKGFDVKNLILQKLLNVTTNGKKVNANDFLDNLSNQETSKLITAYIHKHKLPADIRSFINYLQFVPASDEKYFIKINSNEKFDLRKLCHAFKTDSLKLISKLIEMEFIEVCFDDCEDILDNSRIHYQYMAEGAKFSLTNNFYLYLLNTRPKANSFLIRDFNKAGETQMGKFSNAA